MTIATVADITTGLASPQRQPFVKQGGTPKAAGAFQSLWLASGLPAAGAASPVYTNGSGYTADKSTTGALAYVNAITQNYLARLSLRSARAGVLILADRLWSCSGMGFAAGTYTVTTPGSLPARITDSGVGCELWVENFVAAGAASGTLVANYLNTAAAAKSGTIAAVVSAPVAGQMQPVPMQAGDVGISQLTSVVTDATWTSGTFGMTILKRLLMIEISAVGDPISLDWAKTGLAQIPADACLMLLHLADAVSAITVLGRLDIIDK